MSPVPPSEPSEPDAVEPEPVEVEAVEIESVEVEPVEVEPAELELALDDPTGRSDESAVGLSFRSDLSTFAAIAFLFALIRVWKLPSASRSCSDEAETSPSERSGRGAVLIAVSRPTSR